MGLKLRQLVFGPYFGASFWGANGTTLTSTTVTGAFGFHFLNTATNDASAALASFVAEKIMLRDANLRKM